MRTKIFNREVVLKSLIGKDNPIIFDVGANTGQSVNRFKRIFNDPVIHSFEPQHNVFKQLQNNYPSD